ncbi:hypothetical protein PCL_07169 [Purpureocillium lilacinum]|uniref:Uncharacterized protein n=1 Tax=Purpureocillium lilacinum TaxID=33203 RepID=A0A2U3DT19_PURLI|nr:hypothetical protein PCL_07169 [Purpureocillium lilacinum]
MKKSNEVVGKGKTELVRQQTKGRSGRAGPIPIHSPRVIEQSKPASDRHRRSRGGTIRSWMADIILPTEGDGARGALRQSRERWLHEPDPGPGGNVEDRAPGTEESGVPFVAWAVDLSFSFFLFLRGKQNGDVRIRSRRPGKGSTSTTAAAAAVAEVVDTDTQHLSSRGGAPFHEYEYYFVRPRPASQRGERALLPGLSWTVSHSQSPTQPLTRPIVHEEDEECLDTRAPQCSYVRAVLHEKSAVPRPCTASVMRRAEARTQRQRHTDGARAKRESREGGAAGGPLLCPWTAKRMAMCGVMDKAQAGRTTPGTWRATPSPEHYPKGTYPGRRSRLASPRLRRFTIRARGSLGEPREPTRGSGGGLLLPQGTNNAHLTGPRPGRAGTTGLGAASPPHRSQPRGSSRLPAHPAPASAADLLPPRVDDHGSSSHPDSPVGIQSRTSAASPRARFSATSLQLLPARDAGG